MTILLGTAHARVRAALIDVYDLAMRQHGLVTRAQARRCGLHPSAIDRQVRDGAWLVVFRGVYALAGVPNSWERRVLAAVLASRDAATASHGTAAHLSELKDAVRGRVEITVPGRGPVTLRTVTVHRSLVLAPWEVVVVRGIPTTSVALTLADICGRFDDRRFGRVLDDALIRGLTSLEECGDVARRYAPAPGRRMARFRRALARRGVEVALADSIPELDLVELLISSDVPDPVQQFRVVVDGHEYFIDAAYPDQRVAVEYLGFDAHRTRSAFDHDTLRARRLTAAGWTVLCFTSADTPADIVATVRAALARR